MHPEPEEFKPRQALIANGVRGMLTGGFPRCQTAGCNGIRLLVRWPDGSLTKPCSKSVQWNAQEAAWEVTPTDQI